MKFTTSSIEWPGHSWLDLSGKKSQYREDFEAPEPGNQVPSDRSGRPIFQIRAKFGSLQFVVGRGPHQVDGRSTCPIYQKGQLNYSRLQTDRPNARVGLIGQLNTLNYVFIQLICGSLRCSGYDFCRSRSAQRN